MTAYEKSDEPTVEELILDVFNNGCAPYRWLTIVEVAEIIAKNPITTAAQLHHLRGKGFWVTKRLRECKKNLKCWEFCVVKR